MGEKKKRWESGKAKSGPPPSGCGAWARVVGRGVLPFPSHSPQRAPIRKHPLPSLSFLSPSRVLVLLVTTTQPLHQPRSSPPPPKGAELSSPAPRCYRSPLGKTRKFRLLLHELGIQHLLFSREQQHILALPFRRILENSWWKLPLAQGRCLQHCIFFRTWK